MKRTTLCYIENNGCYLMLYRNSKPDDMNEGKWLGIGGKIEAGETPDECNVREVMEETGLRLLSAHFHGVIHFRSDEYEDEDMYLYSSHEFEPADPEALEIFRATDEYVLPDCSEGHLEWIRKEDIMGLSLWEGDRAFLAELIDGRKTISMTLRYKGDECKIIENNSSASRRCNMDADLERTCELFIRNRRMLADTFRWDGSEMHLIGSAILTAHGAEPDPEDLRACAGIIKSHTDIFSPLRGYLKIIMACSMVLEEDPEEYFANTERAYSLVRITRRCRDDRYYLGAMAMANAIEDKEELLALVDKANELFGTIRSISDSYDEDRAFMTASILAAAGKQDAEEFAKEAQRCISLMEGTFGHTIHTEALAFILTLDKADANFKCARVREIYKLMDAEGVRYGMGEELPVLGPVAMLDMTNADAAAALAEADTYLRNQQGFGRFGSGHDKRHMYAALMVLSAYASVMNADKLAEGAVITGALNSQFAAMAAGTMLLAGEVYRNLTTSMGVGIQ